MSTLSHHIQCARATGVRVGAARWRELHRTNYSRSLNLILTERGVGAAFHSSSLNPVFLPLLELPVCAIAILDLERLGMTTERWRVAVRRAREMKDDSVGSRSIFLLVGDWHAAPSVVIMYLVPGNR